MIKKIGVWALALALLLPSVAAAAGDPGDLNIKSESALFNLIFRLLALARTLFWIVAVAMILYAAFLYLTAGAGGDVGTANKTLKYAVIAIIVAMIATSLPYLIKSLLGGN